MAKCLFNRNEADKPLNNEAKVQVPDRQAPDPQVPDPLNLIMQKHNQQINKDALTKLFSPHNEKQLLTSVTSSTAHVYQIGNYILKVCNTERFKQLEQDAQNFYIEENKNQGPLAELGDFKKIHTDLRDAKQKKPDLPIVNVYAVFEIDGVLPEDRQNIDIDRMQERFHEIGFLHKDNKDKAPLPLTGVVMEKANVYNKIAPGNFQAIRDYDITLLYLQSKGISPDDRKIENMGYILTNQQPVYEINGKYYLVVQPTKENGKFIKTVWFDFDLWTIKDPLSEAALKTEVDKLIRKGVILPRERCMNMGQGA